MNRRKTLFTFVALAIILVTVISFFPLIYAEAVIYEGQDAEDFFNLRYNTMDLWSKIKWMNAHGLLLFTAEGQNRQCSDTHDFSGSGPITINPNNLCGLLNKKSSLVNIYDQVYLGVSGCTTLLDEKCTSVGGYCNTNTGKCVRDNFKEEKRGEEVKADYIGQKYYVDREITIASDKAYDIYCCDNQPCIPPLEAYQWNPIFWLSCPSSKPLCVRNSNSMVEGNTYTYCTSGSCNKGEVISTNCGSDPIKIYENYYGDSSCKILTRTKTCNINYICTIQSVGNARCSFVSCTRDSDCDKWGNGYECDNNKCKLPEQEKCGNSICESSLGENCASCPDDCSCSDDEICDSTLKKCVKDNGNGGNGGNGGDEKAIPIREEYINEATGKMWFQSVCEIDSDCGEITNYTTRCTADNNIMEMGKNKIVEDYPDCATCSGLLSGNLARLWDILTGQGKCISECSLVSNIPIIGSFLEKEKKITGFCVAEKKSSTDFCQFTEWAAFFKITDDKCTDGAIIFIGGVILIILVLKRLM